MEAAALVLTELKARGVTLELRGGGIVARGPAKELERFKPRLQALKPALVSLLSSRKVKCRDCLHATPAATCSCGHEWIGAQLLRRCLDFEPRPAGDEWAPASCWALRNRPRACRKPREVHITPKLCSPHAHETRPLMCGAWPLRLSRLRNSFCFVSARSWPSGNASRVRTCAYFSGVFPRGGGTAVCG